MTDKTEFLTELHPLLVEIEESLQLLKQAEKEFEDARSHFRAVDKKLDLARAAVVHHHDVLTMCLEKGIDPTQAKLLATLKTKEESDTDRSFKGSTNNRVWDMPPMIGSSDTAGKPSRKQRFGSRLLRFFQSK